MWTWVCVSGQLCFFFLIGTCFLFFCFSFPFHFFFFIWLHQVLVTVCEVFSFSM